ASHPVCVHDRTRALTFEARARHFQRRKCPPLGAPPWRFFGCTGALLSLFPGPGSNGCSGGQDSRDAGLVLPRCDRNPLRGRHTFLGLPVSPLEKTPLVSKAEAVTSTNP